MTTTILRMESNWLGLTHSFFILFIIIIVRGAWWHADRHVSGEVADYFTSGSAGSRKTESLGMAWGFENLKAQPSDTLSNRALPVDQTFNSMSLWGHYHSNNHTNHGFVQVSYMFDRTITGVWSHLKLNYIKKGSKCGATRKTMTCLCISDFSQH